MTIVTLHEGDNRDHLRRLIDQGVRVHSVVTDPPYGLTSVVKRFGKEGAAPAKHGTDGVFSRASGGFMGKVWDGTGIERDPEFWRLIWEILLPGGFVFAFSGSRTGHWQACAMEQAGFIMHPMHGWVYGSGFPKARNPCPGIDKLMGVEGGRGAPKPGHEGHMDKDNLRSLRESGTMSQDGGFSRPWVSDPDAVEASHYRYSPGSPEAQKWDGWRYGTQSQKPALEPIYLGQKPFSEKTGVANLLKHGVGAVNIDGCRVPSPGEEITNHSRGAESAVSKGIYGDSSAQETHQAAGQHLGRWPANLLHDGSAEVVALFPDSKGQQGAILGTEKSRTGDENTHCYGQYGARPPTPVRGDEGSAARFFNSFPGGPDAPTIIYHAKATKADRAGSKHPTVKAVGLIEHLVRHVTPPGGVVLDPFAGSGTTGEAARRLGFDCVLMEQDPDYAAFLRQRFDLPTPVDRDLADLLGPAIPANDGSFLDEDIKLLLG